MSDRPKDGQIERLSRAARAAGRRQSLNAALRRLTLLLPVPLAYAAIALACVKWWSPGADVIRVLGLGFVAAWLIVVIGVALSFWRRRPAHAGALALDRHHGSSDRVANALAFSKMPSASRSPFMEAAIADALLCVERPSPSRAVPLRVPRAAWASAGLAGLVILVARSEARRVDTPVLPPPLLPVAAPVALSEDDLGLLRQAGEELRGLSDDPEIGAAVSEFNRVVEDIAAQRVDRQEVFRRLATLERSLAGSGADAEALDQGLKELGERLGESPLARPVAEALKKAQLPDAERAMRELAERLKSKDKPNTAELERLRKALEAASEEAAARVSRLEAARREAEQQQRRLLQKKNAEGAKEPEAQAEAERQRRRLERLERDLGAAKKAQEQLSDLDRELNKAAQNLMREMGKSAQNLQSGAEEVNRMARRQMTEQEKKELLRQLEEMRELIRQGGGGAQHLERLKQFAQRARGRKGEQQPGEEQNQPGGKRGKPQLTLGAGTESAIVPMPGAGSASNQPGNESGERGGKDSGSGRNPDDPGAASALKGKTLDVSAAALDTGQGTASSEVVYGAAERGFTGSRYQKVFTQYRTVAEDVLERDTIPPGYEFYVRRYFQLIRPRDVAPAAASSAAADSNRGESSNE